MILGGITIAGLTFSEINYTENDKLMRKAYLNNIGIYKDSIDN